MSRYIHYTYLPFFVLGVLLFGCADSEVIETREAFPKVFKNQLVEVSAVPDRAIADIPITIRMTAIPLVSGTGRAFIRGKTYRSDGWWTMIAPFEIPMIYDTTFSGGILSYDTAFVKDERLTLEWKVRLSRADHHNFVCEMIADSVFVPDSNRNVVVLSTRHLNGVHYLANAFCPSPCLVLEP